MVEYLFVIKNIGIKKNRYLLEILHQSKAIIVFKIQSPPPTDTTSKMWIQYLEIQTYKYGSRKKHQGFGGFVR